MTYEAEVLADNPLAYWRLGESSGTVATDASGNGRHGTYVNAPILGATGLLTDDADTAMGTAQGSGDRMEIASAAWMNVSQLTVECLFNISSDVDTVSGDGIVARWGAFNWKLWRDTNGKISAQLSNAAGATKTLTGTATATSGTTYHAVMTYDGTTMKVYVDGVEAGSLGSMGGGIWSNASAIQVGQSNAISTNPDGVFDEVAIYGTALSAERIAAHYAAAVGTPSSTTVTIAETLPAIVETINVQTYTPTDLSNGLEGIRIEGGTIHLDNTDPVELEPVAARTYREDVAVAYPTPDLDDGRVT